ncbi:unnamed protein product [Lymnaea stagnalis]|uniref:Uncharacterized protein n=1 Tax=Lymnaea stagnalis TaxID=6523 RepID=A0AAV2I103_LYMST
MASVDLTHLFARHFELYDGTEITFDQSAEGDVGCVVWDAALVLCGYIGKQNCFVDRSVLELGAGTGAVGLTAAYLRARVVITDLPEFVPLLQHNITLNKNKLKGSCTAMALPWGDKKCMTDIKEAHFRSGVDYILLADCVYYEQSLEQLKDTIEYFSTAHTTILCSYEDRDIGNKAELQSRFLKMIGEHFNIVEIPMNSHDEQYCSSDIHILQFNSKSEKLN